MNKKILEFCLEKGVLLDTEILNLFSEITDMDSIKLIIEKIKDNTQQKIITREIFNKNKEQVSQFFLDLPKENQKNLEKLKIKLGLSIEISREQVNRSIINPEGDFQLPVKNAKRENTSGAKQSLSVTYPDVVKRENIVDAPLPQLMSPDNLRKVKILFQNSPSSKKLEVKDFINHFKNRFSQIRDILQTHSELNNLVSINKISGNRQRISIIGIVSDKRTTKNKNIIFDVEDLTGKMRVLVNGNKSELIEKAREVSLDSVVGFNCSGSREIAFVNDIIFPDAMIFERKKSFLEEYALFIGDLHFGSKLFLESNFLKFIDYLNGKVPNTPEVEKIKYLFIIGDIVTGVGNYPNQENDLEIKDLEEQITKLAKFLGRIRKDITVIISPGNHDGVRLMEPQPLFSEKYAWALYELENVVITNNPATVNIGAIENFSGFNVLTYHGFSFPYYAGTVSSLIKAKAMNQPELIMAYLLKNRHLAPTHSSVQYFPFEEDTHLIKNIPDIFVSAHTHKSGVKYYNNILLISVSSWEGKTPYQEKFGNEPDHCKVPMFNLKTREVKILDFE